MEIKLDGKRKAVCLVDEDDYKYLSQSKWTLSSRGKVINSNKEYMHRIIMNATKTDIIDHINSNKLDYRKCNLRKTTRSTRNNYAPKHKNASSKFYGVSKSKSIDKFSVKFQYKCKQHNVGKFSTEIEAAEAYDQYIISNNFDKLLNFPNNKEKYMLNKNNVKIKKDKSCTYKGVYQKDTKYLAKISYNNKQFNLLLSEDPILCAKAYDNFVVDKNICKQLNFPENYPDFDPPKKIKTFYDDVDNEIVRLIIKNTNVVALINKSDYDSIKYYSISVCSAGYLILTVNGTPVRLHKFLTKTGEDVYVDHINSNKMDCTRKNLRLSDKTKNAQNTSKQDGTSSNYVGVSYDKSRTKWASYIYHNGKDHRLGRFDTQEEGARRRDIYILENCQNDHFPLVFKDWTIENIIYWKLHLGLYNKFYKDNYEILSAYEII